MMLISSRPQTSRRKDTQKRILDAAITVFSTKGFHDSTMEDIAVEAEVAKGTLYYNFPSKTGLFVALVTKGMDEFLFRLDREVVSDLPFPQHFRLIIKAHLDVLIDNIELLTIALNPSVYGFDKKVVEEIQLAWKRYLDFLALQLLKGQEQGYIRPGDPSLMAHEVLGALGGILRYYVSVSPGATHEDQRPFRQEWLSEELIRLLGQGILSEPGRAGLAAWEAGQRVGVED